MCKLRLYIFILTYGRDLNGIAAAYNECTLSRTLKSVDLHWSLETFITSYFVFLPLFISLNKDYLAFKRSTACVQNAVFIYCVSLR